MALEDRYAEFEKFIEENKGKRKFEQSVELAINFKGVDFSKQANRLSLDILLPNGKGLEIYREFDALLELPLALVLFDEFLELSVSIFQCHLNPSCNDAVLAGKQVH